MKFTIRKKRHYESFKMGNLYLLIGDPVAQSISPALWNSAFKRMNLSHRYHTAKVEKSQITHALKGLIALNIAGANVTAPHKEVVASNCHKLHGVAKKIGVVNTIKTTPKGLEGWNTDYTSLVTLLKPFCPIRSALVLGSGATAKSAVIALKTLATSQINNIARKFKDHSEKTNNGDLTKLAWNNKNLKQKIQESDIIINATTLGWQKEDNLSELNNLKENHIYIDLNYSLSSNLIKVALEKKCKIIDGYEILLQQAIESFNILTGLTPPVDIMKETISCIKNETK